LEYDSKFLLLDSCIAFGRLRYISELTPGVLIYKIRTSDYVTQTFKDSSSCNFQVCDPALLKQYFFFFFFVGTLPTLVWG